MSPLIVIPSRMASVRLEKKPLADIAGKPMIIHVWERACRANAGPVIVACGDQEIYDVVTAAGGIAIMTDPSLPTGSDRVLNAANIFDPQKKYQIIVNVQGDLPTLDPAILPLVIDPLSHQHIDITTPIVPIEEEREIHDPNVVKPAVAFDITGKKGKALYFSRSPIPYEASPYYHHVGIYGYKRSILERFVSLPQSRLEKQERLEQLRALEDGMHIEAVLFKGSIPFGVDTAEDLERARVILA